jgi:putative flippase GtrA
MNTNNNSISNIAKYYIRDVKIAALLGLIIAILSFASLVMGGYTPSFVLWVVLVFGFPSIAFFGVLTAIAFKGSFPNAVQFAKFGIIGGVSTLINLSILNALFLVTGITSGHLFSAFVAGTFFFGLVNGFFLNKHWAFKTRTSKIHIEFGKFALVASVGLVINVATASFVVNVIGAPQWASPTFWANTGAVIAVFVAMMWNFYGYKHFVFKED